MKANTEKKTTPKKKPAAGFNLLLNGEAHAQAVREALLDKAKSATDSIHGVPIPSLCFQYFIGSRYLPRGRVIEIIGGDGVGKTTLVHTILGWAMLSNYPGCHMETENKPMDEERIKRCYSTDRVVADAMFNAVSRFQEFEITEVARTMLDWAKLIRDTDGGAYVPMEYTGIMVLDTFSKLMTPVEALSVSAYGADRKEAEAADDKKKGRKTSKSKVKDLDEGSNFMHSKLAHKWTRQWPAIMNLYNVIKVVVNHQNDDTKTSMMGGGGFVMTPEQKEATNRTTIGGNSFRQIDSYQMVIGKGMSDYGDIKGIRTQLGQGLKMTMTKNSYGPKRKLNYKINFVNKQDSETHTTPVLDFDVELPELVKLAGFKVTIHSKTEASCAELGLSNASPQDFARHLALKDDLREEIGQRLGIRGYLPSVAVTPPIPTPDELAKPGE